MLRHRLLIGALLLLLVPSAHAQPALPAFSFQTNQLPATADLPDDFELFVPDSTAQMLFNPARAIEYDGRFLYASHTPRQPHNRYVDWTTLPSTFRGTALLGSEQRKWLIVLSNGAYARKDERSTMSHTEDLRIFQDETYRRENETFVSRHVDEKASTVRFRVVGIQGTGSHARAVGLFGAYRRDASALGERRRMNSLQVRMDSNMTDIERVIDREQISDDVQRDYLLGGLEYSRSASHWDWINVFTYQKTLSDRMFKQDERRTRVDSLLRGGELQVFRETHTLNGIIEATSHPNLFRGSSYYRQQLGWLAQRDYAFVSLTGRYAAGNFTYDVQQVRRRWQSLTGGEMRRDTVRQIGDAEKDVWAWRVRSVTGYAIKKRIRDLRGFVGAGLSVAYRQSSNIASSVQPPSPANAVALRKSSDLHSTLTLPVYLRYAISERFALFTGGQYVYRFTRQTSERLHPPS